MDCRCFSSNREKDSCKITSISVIPYPSEYTNEGPDSLSQGQHGFARLSGRSNPDMSNEIDQTPVKQCVKDTSCKITYLIVQH